MQRLATCLRLINRDTNIKREVQTLKTEYYENYNDY